MSNSASVNENVIREVVAEVLGRLGKLPANVPPFAAPAAGAVPARATGGRSFGVFPDANAACEAAQAAYEQLSAQGVAGRNKVVQLIKDIALAKADEWGRLELAETKIGRLDHKMEKLKGLRAVPGVEFLHPLGFSGDHGITLEEYAPFGVIGAVTPSTHSIPTLACNVISMAAAGNAVVFNAHPGACQCAVTATRFFNEAIFRELGIENLACIVEPPTLESFAALAKNELIKLLCVTGGPGVVKAAMASGKRAVCAGPGNPPVLVDGTACLEYAARCIIFGAAYDNNLLCIGEKEVFVLDSVFEPFMAAMEKHGAVRLTSQQVERLTQAAFSVPPGQGAGCGHPVVNRDLIGRDATTLARLAGATVPAGTELLFAETPADHLFVEEEQMMPFLPIVRVKSVAEGIAAARKAEHGYKHSAIIHSHDVAHMTDMAKALETTLFIKNGACLAGLGSGGEGYPNFSIATTTGEGICNPRTFTRVRRCVMVDKLRIF
ncbi:MAG: aldehyde dehydrogenase family protein [Verrucomicrobiota bacterium]|jgi:aldehyde dehydrogenase